MTVGGSTTHGPRRRMWAHSTWWMGYRGRKIDKRLTHKRTRREQW